MVCPKNWNLMCAPTLSHMIHLVCVSLDLQITTTISNEPAVGHTGLGGEEDAGDDKSVLPWESLSHRVNILSFMCLEDWAAHFGLLDHSPTCCFCMTQMKVVRSAQLENYA